MPVCGKMPGNWYCGYCRPDDFETGEVNKLVKSITISDKLERPTRWRDNDYYYQRYLGNWSGGKSIVL